MTTKIDFSHIKEPYSLSEILSKYKSRDYSAEVLLQHALLILQGMTTNSSEQIKGLMSALCAALEWIDAVPSDVSLPPMPGFDRDWVESLLDQLPQAVQPTGEWNAAVEAAPDICKHALNHRDSEDCQDFARSAVESIMDDIEALKRQPSEVSEQAVSDEDLDDLRDKCSSWFTPAGSAKRERILDHRAYARALLSSAPQAAEQKAQSVDGDVGERESIADLIVRDVCEMDPANPNLNDTICIDVSDLLTLVKRHTTALSAQSEKDRTISNFKIECETLRHGLRQYERRISELGISEQDKVDAQCYEWLRQRFVGYDFEWGDPPMVCAVFEVGQEFLGGRDINAAILAARAAQEKAS